LKSIHQSDIIFYLILMQSKKQKQHKPKFL